MLPSPAVFIALIWLLDAFAFGLVVLTGSGITATANDDVIAGTAAVITALTLAVGVPIACLLGLSGYRLAEYLQPHIAFNLPGSSSVLITASYTIAVLWALAAVYVIRDYFKSYFVKANRVVEEPAAA